MKAFYKISFYFLLFNFLFTTSKSYAGDNFWLGTDAGNPTLWSVAANWQLGVPSSGDGHTVIFDDNNGGNDNACTIDANATCDAIEFRTGYTRTVTLASGITLANGGLLTVTAGTFDVSAGGAVSVIGPFTVNGGTFTGGSSDVDCAGNVTINGGTFTAPSGNLNMYNPNTFDLQSGTFAHNNGTLFAFIGGVTTSITITGAPVFYNLTVDGSATSALKTLAVTTSCTVNNTLTISGTRHIAITGTINAKGDITITNTASNNAAGGSGTIEINGTADQTLTGQGTAGNGRLCNITVNKAVSGTLILASVISVNANWTYTAGTVDAGSSTVVFTGTRNLDGETAGGTEMTFYNLTIGISGVTSTTTLTGNVNISGALTVGGGATSSTLDANSNVMLFTSTATTHARIASLGTVGTINNATNMTFQRYIPGTVGGYLMMGSPTTNATFEQIDDDLGIFCPGCSDGTLGGYYTIWSHSEATNAFSVVNDDGDPMTNGQGYFVHYDDGGDSDPKTTNPTTIEIVGPPKTGQAVLAPTITGAGFNLLANPYPCPISWATLEAAAGTPANISNTFWIWNADLLSGQGDYASATTGDIAPFQAFFVLLTGATSLNAEETHKSTSTNTTFLKTTEVTTNSLQLNLHAPAHNDGNHLYNAYTTETLISFAPGASNYFNGNEDGMRLDPGNGASIIFTEINDTIYAHNKLPELTEDISIPVRVKGFSGVHSISISDYDSIPSSSCIILEDLFTGIKTDLRAGDYTFDFIDTTTVPRFLIHFSAPFNFSSQQSDATCYQGNEGMLIANPGAGQWNYTWKNEAGVVIKTNSSSTADSLTNLTAGRYSVEITKATCNSPAKETYTITQPEATIANFNPSADTLDLAVNPSVNFTNASLFANTYEWNFGDGGTSTAENPSHTYTLVGDYEVSLIAKQGDCLFADTTVYSAIHVTNPNNINAINNVDKSILITTNTDGVFVELNFDQSTKVVISAYNILGQKITSDITTQTNSQKIKLNIENNNSILFVSVQTPEKIITKKIIN